MLTREFYQGKRVLVTGHTGFKGSWLCEMLCLLGADVYGYALKPEESSLYQAAAISNKINSHYGDIRNQKELYDYLSENKPEIVFHLAAQPLVRESYIDPVYTYETNVMGTIYLFDAIRKTESVRSVVNITTDKVYLNKEWDWGYRETDTLCGRDPYSNSKSCSELISYSYQESYFRSLNISLSTVRAGNVIGGGDFGKDRIIPDCVRAAKNHETILLRNPNSVRPYQFVLEALSAYLLLAQKQWENPSVSGSYNIGPNQMGCVTTEYLVRMFCEIWGEGLGWSVKKQSELFAESNFLKLDSSHIYKQLGFSPKYDIQAALTETIRWYKAYLRGEDISLLTENIVSEYLLK